MERKEAVYKGLEFIPVFYEDPSLTSPDYFQISEFPTKLTAGKNLFKLRGHPTNLTTGGALGIEVLDYNGDPIYTEVVDFIDEDKSRVIAIYIYEETSPGDCTVTLVAEASVIEGIPTPEEYQGRVNIRWTRSIPVNPNISNNSEIIFETLPDVTIREQIGIQLDRSYSNGQFPTYGTGRARLYTYNGQPAVEIVGATLTTDMKTGTITVASPVNPTPTPEYPVVTTPYVSTIKKILTPTTALLDKEYTVLSSESIFPHTYSSFEPSAYSITYEATPTYTETENSQSYAYIEVKDLEPATGDINRIKVYTNNKGTAGTFELVNDVELEETEIFIPSTSSLFPDISIGELKSQSTIDTYWEGHTYFGNTETTAPNLPYTVTNIDAGVFIRSALDISPTNHVLTFQNKSAYNGVFVKDSSYKVTFDAHGQKSTFSNFIDPVLAVYMSGSAFDYDPTDFLNQELPVTLGKRIGEIRIDTDSQVILDQTFSFNADNTGHGSIIFVVEGGAFNVADIHVTSDNDAGYTPNYNRIKTFIETTHKIDNQISFKLEYYNVDGVASKQVTFVNNLDWEGGNRYVDGNFSMLTGSLYVADSIESGVALTGNPSTGFIRSLDYQGFESGFPGFLMWSGSALAGQNTKGGVPYTGVGLELYAHTASYFRYSTADSEIDVRTDKFFFGNISSSFISGSNGLIQITSSNFVLSPEGNVSASNALFGGTAIASAILNRTITITAANSSSYFLNTTADDGPSTPVYNLVLDGSLGGDIAIAVNISCNLQRPIYKFVLPDYGSSEESTDIRIENNGTNTKLINGFLKKGTTIGLAAYDQLDVTNGAVLVLAARGNGASQLIYPIAGSENISGLSTDGFLIRRDLRVGDGDNNGGTMIISRSLASTIQFKPGGSDKPYTIGHDTTTNSFQIVSGSSLDNNLTSFNAGVGFVLTKDGEIHLPEIDAATGTNYVRYDTSTREITYLTSTQKIKKNIVTPSSSIYNNVLSLQPRYYQTKNPKDANQQFLSFIAEEVAAVSPTLATYGADFNYDESGSRVDLASDNIVPIDINERAIIAALVGKIQDLEQRITTLENN